MHCISTDTARLCGFKRIAELGQIKHRAGVAAGGPNPPIKFFPHVGMVTAITDDGDIWMKELSDEEWHDFWRSRRHLWGVI